MSQLRRTTPEKPQKRAPRVIDVGVACILRNGRYLVGQRSARRGGVWEFPGGKREVGETVAQCLRREVREEVGLAVSVKKPFLVKEMVARGKRFRLHFCVCSVRGGSARRTEHQALSWVRPTQLLEISFPKANREAVKFLLR